jgi:transcriptional regulator with XRE-family HTH domain
MSRVGPLALMRLAARKTARQVAEEVGKDPVTIRALERGESDPPVSLIVRYAKAVGVTPELVFSTFIGMKNGARPDSTGACAESVPSPPPEQEPAGAVGGDCTGGSHFCATPGCTNRRARGRRYCAQCLGAFQFSPGIQIKGVADERVTIPRRYWSALVEESPR